MTQPTPVQTGRKTPGEDLFISIILDRSGSMGSVRDDTIGAINALVSDIATQDGKTLLTLTQFDSQSVDVILDAAPIDRVPPLTHATFQPRGSTPLLDAVGNTLSTMQRTIERIGWTGSILVVVVTDGQENASTQWTRTSVFALVKALEAAGWGFTYLGASPDAYADAQQLGFAAGSTSRWEHDGRNVASVGQSISAQAGRWRKGQAAAHELILDAERKIMEKKHGR